MLSEQWAVQDMQHCVGQYSVWSSWVGRVLDKNLVLKWSEQSPAGTRVKSFIIYCSENYYYYYYSVSPNCCMWMLCGLLADTTGTAHRVRCGHGQRPFTPTAAPAGLTCMSLGCGKVPELLEETHTYLYCILWLNTVCDIYTHTWLWCWHQYLQLHLFSHCSSKE